MIFMALETFIDGHQAKRGKTCSKGLMVGNQTQNGLVSDYSLCLWGTPSSLMLRDALMNEAKLWKHRLHFEGFM